MIQIQILIPNVVINFVPILNKSYLFSEIKNFFGKVHDFLIFCCCLFYISHKGNKYVVYDFLFDNIKWDVNIYTPFCPIIRLDNKCTIFIISLFELHLIHQ